MSQGPSVFVADVAWRLEAPPPRRGRARLFVAIVVAILIELGVFALIWIGRSAQPAPEIAEIPVEIIVEKPPPPPPPTPQASPTPKPTPPPELKAPDDEKPATDAPRAGTSDHDDEHVGKKEKPAAPPASPEPTPTPTPAKAASPEPTPTPTASTPAETAAPELPKAEQAEAPPPAKTETPKPAAQSAAAAVLPKVFANVPDLDFGGAAVKSEVTGGNAKATYLSKVFGLVEQHFHVPPLARAYGRTLHGKLIVVVDAHGRILQRYVSESSGSSELDEAAMEAVGAAARSFPPPPSHRTAGMYWQYSSND